LVLEQAAEDSHTGDSEIQSSDKIAQIILKIKSTIRESLPDPARKDAIKKVSQALHDDASKCRALYLSELEPADFTRSFLKIPAEPSSSGGSNGIDDISQVCTSQNYSCPAIPPFKHLEQSTDEKSQSIANLSNHPTLPTSVVSTQPTTQLSVVAEPQNLDLFSTEQLQEYLKIHGINSLGDRHDLIKRCKAVERIFSKRNSTPVDDIETEAAQAGTLTDVPAPPPSVSSDGPPPQPSVIKSFLKNILSLGPY